MNEEVPIRSPESIVGAAARLSATPDLAATLQGIAAAALTSLGADRATCYAYDVGAQVVSAVYTTESDPRRRAFLERTVGLGAAKLPIWELQLSQDDPMLVIDDVTRSPHVSPELAERLGSGAFLGVRLEHLSVQQAGVPALLGTLFCSYGAPRSFSQSERQVARGLGGLATMALANAHLQFETSQRLEENRVLAAEQAALRRVATLVAAEAKPEQVFARTAEEVAALFGVECGLVARFEPNHAVRVGAWGATTTVFDLPFSLSGAGALSQVWRTGKAARVDDFGSLPADSIPALVLEAGYRGSVAAPVRVGGRLWGGLLAITTQDRKFDTDAEERLERFAALVALAIANAEAQARLASQAATDALTGLANHGVFFERLHAEVERARRNQHPLALVLLDLDHFKRVNDIHGHLVGDSVLVEMAGRLASLARPEDTVARVGGEEFAWLLPESDEHGAWAAGERVRRAVAGTPFAEIGLQTLSAGIAQFKDGMSAYDLFRAADGALYEAKARGRDTCVPASSQGELRARATAVQTGAHVAPSVERLLSLAREQLGFALVAVTQFVGDSQTWRHVEGDGGLFGISPGESSPLEGSYCKLVLDGRLPNLIRDARRDDATRDLPATHKTGVGAYAGVSISLPDGGLYGMLCCMSPRPEPELGLRDLRLLKIVAGMIGEELGREEIATRVQRQRYTLVRQVLDGDRVNIVFQPIVDLSTGRVVAVEALSRFPDDPGRTPDVLFAEAAQVDLGIELELAAVRAAIERIDDVPDGARLSVNASPNTVCSPLLHDLLASVPADRLAVELTEHAFVEDLNALAAAIGSLKARGVQIMIDDAGAGFSGLKRILGLQPDVIKLDLALTRHIDTDPVRRALAAALVAFARETDVTIVAEGIETRAELDALQLLGVTQGQGYFLGRPRPGAVPRYVGLAGPKLIESASVS